MSAPTLQRWRPSFRRPRSRTAALVRLACRFQGSCAPGLGRGVRVCLAWGAACLPLPGVLRAYKGHSHCFSVGTSPFVHRGPSLAYYTVTDAATSSHTTRPLPAGQSVLDTPQPAVENKKIIMSEYVAILTPVSALSGVIIGAILKDFLFARWSEIHKQEQTLRNQAYVDYLRAVTRIAHANSEDAKRAGLEALTEAKARISVYGSPAVF
ncbi:MAG: hypothetical protein NZ890_12630 [Myxococcota bacterium]|nr:hypothetical protein [Myxococcota bacterium]